MTHAAYATRPFRLPGFVDERSRTVDVGDLAVESGASVTRRVVDDDGEPLAGVSVRAASSALQWQHVELSHRGSLDAFARTVTSDDGRFLLTGLWHGTVTLAFHTEGRAPILLPRIDIVAGQVSDVGDVVVGGGASTASSSRTLIPVAQPHSAWTIHVSLATLKPKRSADRWCNRWCNGERRTGNEGGA